jgi:uncharacterized membrane protein YuzA (DUF378 family)
VADGPGRLRLMAGHAEAFARLRADWVGLGLPGLPGRLSDTELLALLESAIASRRLAVAFFPRPVDPLDRLAADTIPRQPAPAAPVAAKSVRDMSRSERVEAALKRVPAHLTGELKNAFLGLISPTSIGITVAAFAGLAVAQFFGYGEAADAVLAAIAYGIAGLSGVRALYDMVAATVSAATATNDAEIDAAAVRLANAFVVLGMAFLTIFITRAARKAAQSRAAASSDAPPSATTDAPPAQRRATSRGAPLPRTLPGAGEAVIDPRKFTDYALNPDHPVGRNKARVFQSALGFNKANSADLISQIQSGVRTSPAILGRVDEFGTRYTVDIPVTGPAGSGIVRTGWIIDAAGGPPRLTTALVR